MQYLFFFPWLACDAFTLHFTILALKKWLLASCPVAPLVHHCCSQALCSIIFTEISACVSEYEVPHERVDAEGLRLTLQWFAASQKRILNTHEWLEDSRWGCQQNNSQLDCTQRNLICAPAGLRNANWSMVSGGNRKVSFKNTPQIGLTRLW